MKFEKVNKTAKLLTEYFRRYRAKTIFNAKIIPKTMKFEKVDKTAKLFGSRHSNNIEKMSE
jgi:hypothetical protein